MKTLPERESSVHDLDVCGVLVHARPGETDRVRTLLQALPGVQVHTTTADGRLVVTAEDSIDATGRRLGAGAALMAIDRTAGVLSTTLVYQHTEPGQPPLPPADE